jgi:hypothetical protein
VGVGQLLPQPDCLSVGKVPPLEGCGPGSQAAIAGNSNIKSSTKSTGTSNFFLPSDRSRIIMPRKVSRPVRSNDASIPKKRPHVVKCEKNARFSN